MSQRCIYECDQCRKEIGKNNHITLMLSAGSGTGIATFKDIPGSWETIGLGKNFIHFCTSKCIAAYFEVRLKGTLKAKKK